MRSLSYENNQLGVTLNLSPVRAASESVGDAIAARLVDGGVNRLYLDPLFRGSYPEDVLDVLSLFSDFSFVHDDDLEIISAPMDFLGVNYYMRQTVEVASESDERVLFTLLKIIGAQIIVPPGIETTAMGWGIEPDGLTELLLRLSREYTGLPLYITENGAAFHDYVDPEGDVDDEERVTFLDAHFRAAYEAVEQGANLKGYFVWSLLDNFEWAEGYSKRFGIVYVDYLTQRRIPKMSAHWYKEVIRRNGLAEPDQNT
jgi:beta-glucosidase